MRKPTLVSKFLPVVLSIVLTAGNAISQAPAPQKTPAPATKTPDPKSKKATPAKTAPIVLPEATIHTSYEVVFPMNLNIHYGRAKFTLGPRPDWLYFDPYTSTLFGDVTETKPIVYSITLKAEDMDDPTGASKTYVLTLPVVDRPQMAIIPGTAAPKLATPVPATGKPLTFTARSARIVDATLATDEKPATNPTTAAPDAATKKQPVTTPPANAPAEKPAQPAPLQSRSGAAAPAEANADEIAPAKDPTPPITPPPAIPVPTIYLDSQPTAGGKISGHVTGLASPATASVPPDTTKGTPAKPGNLPLIGLVITDPVKGTFRAPLTITATQTALSVEVSHIDGTFTLQPATALTFGQKVSVIAEAPPGHTFEDKTTVAASPAHSYDIATPTASTAITTNKAVQAAVNPLAPAPADMQVYSGIPLVKPALTTPLVNNTLALSGTATPSTNIAILRFKSETDQHAYPTCVTADQLEPGKERFELLTGTSGTVKTVASNSSGTFAITLTEPLLEGDKVQVVQVLPANAQVPENQASTCNSGLYPVNPEGDWGRIHADFTAGILLSNNNQIATTDSGNFSQAHEFFALTLEWAWQLPGCYLRSFKDKDSLATEDKAAKKDSLATEDKAAKKDSLATEDKAAKKDTAANIDYCYDNRTNTRQPYKSSEHWKPGLSGYFESRLTAIPVTTLSSKQTSSTAAASVAHFPFAIPAASSATPTDTSTASILSSNQLGTAQTARLGVGIYAPFLLTRWEYRNQPNALFIAPLAKAGFDTVTGASSVTVVPGTPGASLPAGTTSATITAESLYNYRGYGARLGHFAMTRSERRAPETNSYLDVLFGPYSNLESLICNRTIATAPASGSTLYGAVAGQKPPTNYSGSSCLADYPSYYIGTPPGSTTANPLVYAPLDIRKRLYRLDLEGLLKIPNTPVYVGFNANVGQKTVGGSHLDHGYAAPDDLRFLFGTKFDISTLLSKVGIKPF